MANYKKKITCAGDDYKVKQLRDMLEYMDFDKHPEDWKYVQVKCGNKAINLDVGAVNLLIDYYTNTYNPANDAYVSGAVKCSTSQSADIIPELLTGSADAYIQEWSKQYKGTPETSWDNIFDNVLFDFTLYAEDEASADEEGITFADGLELGLYTDDDIFNEFEQFVMFKDLEDYDVR